MDLLVNNTCVEDGKKAAQRFLVEIKVVQAKWSLETTVAMGLVQAASYAKS